MNNLMRVEITDTGLVGVENLNEAEFFEYGVKLGHIEKGMQWAIGDWYNNIPWGDKPKACERAGINYLTAQAYAKTSRAYEFSKRLPNLTFHHHTTLVHEELKASDRERLLKRAVAEGWSGAMLKKERDIIMEIATPAPTKGFDDGVDKLTAEVVKALPEGTSKTVINKTKSGIKHLASDLKHEFTSAVEKTAEAKAKVQKERAKEQEKKAKEEFDRTIQMQAGVKAFMTKAEFTLVRKCLHPDVNPHPKAAEAFAIFNRLAEVKNW